MRRSADALVQDEADEEPLAGENDRAESDAPIVVTIRSELGVERGLVGHVRLVATRALDGATLSVEGEGVAEALRRLAYRIERSDRGGLPAEHHEPRAHALSALNALAQEVHRLSGVAIAGRATPPPEALVQREVLDEYSAASRALRLHLGLIYIEAD